MRAQERSVTIQGKDLAAALLFAGAELVDKEKTCVLYGDVESRRWHFRPVTDRGVPVKKLISAFEQEKSRQVADWSPSHAEALNNLKDEELFALAMMAIEWRHVVEKTERERKGDLCVAPTPNSRLVLGPGLTKAKEEVLLRRAGV
tara:strand:+ start:8431 stop:8868 length:438 start_codon:yes stop_codon:yes gene_type:complete